jgi:hypothetical protein
VSSNKVLQLVKKYSNMNNTICVTAMLDRDYVLWPQSWTNNSAMMQKLLDRSQTPTEIPTIECITKSHVGLQ